MNTIRIRHRAVAIVTGLVAAGLIAFGSATPAVAFDLGFVERQGFGIVETGEIVVASLDCPPDTLGPVSPASEPVFLDCSDQTVWDEELGMVGVYSGGRVEPGYLEAEAIPFVAPGTRQEGVNLFAGSSAQVVGNDEITFVQPPPFDGGPGVVRYELDVWQNVQNSSWQALYVNHTSLDESDRSFMDETLEYDAVGERRIVEEVSGPIVFGIPYNLNLTVDARSTSTHLPGDLGRSHAQVRICGITAWDRFGNLVPVQVVSKSGFPYAIDDCPDLGATTTTTSTTVVTTTTTTTTTLPVGDECARHEEFHPIRCPLERLRMDGESFPSASITAKLWRNIDRGVRQAYLTETVCLLGKPRKTRNWLGHLRRRLTRVESLLNRRAAGQTLPAEQIEHWRAVLADVKTVANDLGTYVLSPFGAVRGVCR